MVNHCSCPSAQKAGKAAATMLAARVQCLIVLLGCRPDADPIWQHHSLRSFSPRPSGKGPRYNTNANGCTGRRVGILSRGRACQTYYPELASSAENARVRSEVKHAQSIAGPWAPLLPRRPRRMAVQQTRDCMDAAARRNATGPKHVGLTPKHGVTGSGVLGLGIHIMRMTRFMSAPDLAFHERPMSVACGLSSRLLAGRSACDKRLLMFRPRLAGTYLHRWTPCVREGIRLRNIAAACC